MYQELKSIEDAVDQGDEEATAVYIENASEMVDEFRRMEAFYPRRDKHVKFVGYIGRKGSHFRMKESALAYLATVSNREGASEGDPSTHLDVGEQAPEDFHDIPFDEWLDIFCRYALLLAKHGQHPYSNDAYRLFGLMNRLYSGHRSWYNGGPSQKFVLRLIKAMDFALLDKEARLMYKFGDQERSGYTRGGQSDGNPEGIEEVNVALLAMYGHVLASGGAYLNALNYYFRAYSIEPEDAILNFSIAIAYYELRTKAGSALQRQEAEFNVARVWHMLGLFHLALPAYERVLALRGRVRAEHAKGGPDEVGGWEDFSTDAAFAMQTILALTEDFQGARNLTNDWLAAIAMEQTSGSHLIARALRDLGVTVLFGIVGIPVIDIAEQAINLGIRFVGFRNEQAASYAATAYGYLTGRPGVCLVVGGPGVLHAMAGVGNSNANAFPLLLLAGSSETHLQHKGGFQELDAVSLLTPHTKFAIRPQDAEAIPLSIQNAYRAAWYGRPGTAFVDLPADLIEGKIASAQDIQPARPVPNPPSGGTDHARLSKIALLVKGAKAPLVVIGKGAAYAQAEVEIRELIEKTSLPFLPSPMGKGVLPDSHPLNASSARSAALKDADLVLLLGARLNWIFHFGESPKWNPEARFIQVDISPEEIGRNRGDAELGIVGDLKAVVPQLLSSLSNWQYASSESAYLNRIESSKRANEEKASKAAAKASTPLSYAHTFDVIKKTLHKLSPPEEGGVVYVSEGANTMDISRSVFPVDHPRLRLDAGTYATMGVGLGYAIAAHEAYNGPIPEAHLHTQSSQEPTRKKIVAFEGDSAFGFSAMEIETMARYQMDVLIFVINNGGVYHGDSDSAEEWLARQKASLGDVTDKNGADKLRSTSLGWEVGYEKIAEMCGGLGFLTIRTKCPISTY
ncbi:putative 2-hydroxyphytanoyl- lyase protein [Neofusicoccum parvum UCRNP2]|uniref:2-hydroxyacyl-CoA lyase n=1 Tax=Botryosphaeria parva (strain UCR-NP2) TaxID=1287680 RepID=R1GII2_BOTPV|nr:putative 2-hydroxyphytanoyl- lyase protein [Neofusicoccum parvum UCRNP2]